MGVRWAETITTSCFDMLDLVAWSAAARAPLGRSGGGCLRHRPGTQSVFKDGDKGCGNLRAGHGLVLPIPMGDPVERAGERESGHFGVAGVDGAVLDALTDEAADAMVDLRLERLDVTAHCRRKILLLGAHHAPAKLR